MWQPFAPNLEKPLMKDKEELRDIYKNESPDFETDFTPQVTQDVIEQRQRHLQRTRLASLFFGGMALIISVALVTLVIQNFLHERELPKQILPKDMAFIPRHTLSSDATWIMDYERIADQIDLDEEAGEKPLSVKWVKKAAYHIIMGQQSLAITEPDSALEHFQKVIEIYPEIRGLHRSVGMLYFQREEFEKAAEHFERSLQEKELSDVINDLGRAYMGNEEYEKAEETLLRALKLKSESPLCHKNLAVLYRKMERENSSILHFEKYIDLVPNDLDTLQLYALYLTELARWEEAAKFLTELTQEVTNVAPIYFLLAQVHIQNGQREKAIQALQRGIQLIDPNLALAWMSHEEFNDVRQLTEFQTLMDALEISSVSLDDTQ